MDPNPPVVLAVAPFLSLVRPALGVSTLKSALAAAGIDARIEYFNLAFAELVGPVLCEDVCEYTSAILLGEWVFSEAAQPGQDGPAKRAFLAKIHRFLSPHHRDGILRARALAPQFAADCARKLVDANPRIVGFTTTFQQNCASLAIARRVKELAPEITICFGGANCEGPMGEAMLEAYPQVDHVFSGEAEHSFPDFVAHALRGTKRRFYGPSVLSRGERSEAATPPPIALDELPVPDFSDYFSALERASFKESVTPALLFESSRGCWWGAKHHCKFCGLNGTTMAYRSKSPARVLDEIRTLHARHAVDRLEAVDNILDPRHVGGVLDELAAAGLELRIFYEIKANMNEDQLRRMALGGVTWVQPGIESLDDECLKNMDKGVTALQNVCLLRNCREIGIHVVWNLLCGFPGDTAEQYARMARLMPLLQHLDPPTGISPVALHRFSPWFERAQSLGFTNVRPIHAYDAVYEVPAGILARLAYFFEGRVADCPEGDYVWPLRRSLAEWQERALAGRAILAFESGGEHGTVRDTRSCARARTRELDERDARLLEAFRAPRKIELALEQLGGEPLRSAFDDLVACRLVAVDRDRAVSLVVDPSRTVLQHGGKADAFPGGGLERGSLPHMFAAEPRTEVLVEAFGG